VTSIHRHRALAVVVTAVMFFAVAAPVRAQGTNDALLRLLRILRDRGSISADEYEDLRLAAGGAGPETPATAPRPAATPVAIAVAVHTPPAAPNVLASADSPDARVQALDAQVAKQADDVVKKALANKWYEKIGLRGYTQFRVSEVRQGEGPDLEVPADRSVNPTESMIIRRGRLVFSGDATEHLYVYAQTDFNGSPGTGDFALQMRDLYADINLDTHKAWRVRLGQSKVPYGWANMQSSQNRAPFERPDAINSAVEGERDYGAYLMWAAPEARRRFRDLTALGLKGSGDYGVVAVGVFNGQGLNRPDQNGDPHVMARASYPFKLNSGQFFEVGVQGYYGKFVTQTQAIGAGGTTITPTRDDQGSTDERVGFTGVWYPQPIGVETEWNFGRGPELSADLTRVETHSLQGGYVQVNYRKAGPGARSLFPFTRWQYFDGARKFARNAPREKVNEIDLGLEFAHWAELELTAVWTHTFERTRTSAFPYDQSRGANRVGFQAQWNY
jgi:hypothetical protein